MKRDTEERAAAVPADQDTLVGRTFDKYRFVERLGGGLGRRVYRAKHTTQDREFAVRVLSGDWASNQRVVERFKLGSEKLSMLNHPNVVSVRTVSSADEGRLLLVMDLVAGRSLEDLIKWDAPLAPDRALEVVIHIARGLSAAHRLGFVHKELNPSNVIITKQDGVEVAKIIGFGLYDLLHVPGTRAAPDLRTATYMAPEQIDRSLVGPQADMYALGIIFYELLSGKPPFTADEVAELQTKHATMRVPELDAAGDLRPVLQWMLEKVEEHRPSSADAVLDTIEALLAKRGGAPAPPRSTSNPFLRSGFVPTGEFTPPLGETPGPMNLSIPTTPSVPFVQAAVETTPETNEKDREAPARPRVKKQRSFFPSLGAVIGMQSEADASKSGFAPRQASSGAAKRTWTLAVGLAVICSLAAYAIGTRTKPEAQRAEPQLAPPPRESAKPLVEEPVVEKPAVEKPAVEEPLVEEPVVEKAAVEKPVEHPLARPAAEKPVEKKLERPAVEKELARPAVEKPVEHPLARPAVEKPVEHPLARLESKLQAALTARGMKLADLDARPETKEAAARLRVAKTKGAYADTASALSELLTAVEKIPKAR